MDGRTRILGAALTQAWWTCNR